MTPWQLSVALIEAFAIWRGMLIDGAFGAIAAQPKQTVSFVYSNRKRGRA